MHAILEVVMIERKILGQKNFLEQKNSCPRPSPENSEVDTLNAHY
jgi:hypothetical protein